MNSTLKSLLFWMVLVVVGVLVWNFSTRFQRSDQAVSFSTFMTQVETGQVSSVTITGNEIQGVLKSNEQFRTQYLIHAPTNYDTSFANIVAPPAANITVDGAPVAGFTPIGGTGFSVARIPLSNAGDGNHLFEGDQPFGVMIYGYGQYTSYWYPGGLDLNVIPQ